MTQSSKLRFFRFNKGDAPKALTATSGAAISPTTTTDLTPPPPPPPAQSQTNVNGWLMSVPGYREDAKTGHAQAHNRQDQDTLEYTIVDGDNNGIPIDKPRKLRNGRPPSIASVSSSDSVNLDELIKNNYTVQVDDETDLPNLADLDLDDSTDDFWKLGDTLADFKPSAAVPREQQQQQPAPIKTKSDSTDLVDGPDLLSIDEPFDENMFMGPDKLGNDDRELVDWSPESTDDHLETLSISSSRTAQSRLRAPSVISSSRYSVSSSDHGLRTQRSGSLSSENSFTSQSTITTGVNHYMRYGMTPQVHPSESLSSSSRSHSRLSDYSASSSQASSTNTTSGIPRARAGSQTSTGLPVTHNSGRRSVPDHRSGEPLRSSSRIGSHLSPADGRSRLAKRATHVPVPSNRTAPKPPMATASRSTGLSNTRLTNSNNGASPSSAGSRSGSRMSIRRPSHIPAAQNSAASPEPPPATSPTLGPVRGLTSRPRSPMAGGTRVHSPTPGNNPRNSIFGLATEKKSTADAASRISRPPSSAATSRPTGLRPPSTIGGINKVARSRRA